MAGHAETDHDGLRVDHHFENSDQQFQSAKLGMWLFLGTEILFFGGLFVAYSVYRSNHPEIFVFGHHFLDKNLGALNTVILICSSLTAAWAVRAAQLRQIKLLKLMIALTLACAFGFMGVKAVEYNSKWKHGLLWAGAYDPHVKHDEHEAEPEVSAPAAEAPPAAAKEIGAAVDAAAEPATEDDPANRIEASNIAPAADGPAGLADPTAAGEAADDEMLQPANAQIYFSIYFLLTGLHGIHVLGGIGAFVWLFRSASAGYFDSGHFTRVDMVALYWHLVDLIWIYLFFLLYLIH